MSINTKCQVFTPPDIVDQLLDLAMYKDNLFGKKIAENSCGDGNILAKVVERYIVDCINNNINLIRIKKGLESDIWGSEVDDTHITSCIEKLDSIAEKYDLRNVKWKIEKEDFLKLQVENEFDFVIGNPPYITYHDLSQDDRDFIRRNYKTCRNGRFDYCYAFIEASINSLKPNGKLAYLIPSSIFKNLYATELRNFILPHLTTVVDFTTKKLFEGKLIASAIIVCEKNRNLLDITYFDKCNDRKTKLIKSYLDQKWQFNSFKSINENEKTIRFGDYFHTANSIATLANDVFIINDFKDCNEYIMFGEFRVEKAILHKAISPRSINFNKEELIIFPYYFDKRGLNKYSEQEFKNMFPEATNYLKNNKITLDRRKSDNGIKWFEYGRSQALAHMNQHKLLISTLITNNVKVTKIDENTIPTSGLYIVPKNGQTEYSLDFARNVLKSESFLQYIKSIGVISNAYSFRITSKDVNNFFFSTESI